MMLLYLDVQATLSAARTAAEATAAAAMCEFDNALPWPANSGNATNVVHNVDGSFMLIWSFVS